MLASGVTAIAGFAALIASDIRMLRDFGILTVVDLSVSLLGVMLVLPAALVWAEQHGPLRDRARSFRAGCCGRVRPRSRCPPRRRAECLSEDRFGDLGGAGTSRSAGRALRGARTARTPSPTAAAAAGGPAAGQQVRLGGRDRDADGHRACCCSPRPCPTPARALRGPKRGERCPPSPRRWRPATSTATRRQRLPAARPAPTRPATCPACEHRAAAEVVNVCCELRERPLVLTFVVTRGADCEPQVDRVERMKGEFPGVNFAVVMSGNDRDEVRADRRRRGWTMPVAVDHDGAVVNLYGVGVCPTTVFSTRGGQCASVEPRQPDRGRAARADRSCAELVS